MLLCKLGLTCLIDSVYFIFVKIVNSPTQLHSIYNFALTGIPLNECLFLYDSIGSLMIPLCNGHCCIKWHLLISIFLRFETVG